MTDDPKASHSSAAESADTSQEVAIELPSRNHLADWDIITAMMKTSRLPGLDLKDIIHILYLQEAHVKHIEPVVRTDLLELFLNTATQLRQEERDWRWDIAFHGTLRENIPSIIEHGFKLPSRDASISGHRSRFLVNWGPGIYCSSYATYSYSYGHNWENGIHRDGVMLDPEATVGIFICAVIRGIPYTCAQRSCRRYSQLVPNYDSHVNPSLHEWIIFDEKRIIPLCIMWVKKRIDDVFFSNHYDLQPFCGNSVSVTRTKKLLAASEESKYTYQRYRKKRTCFQDGAEANSEMTERIRQLGSR